MIKGDKIAIGPILPIDLPRLFLWSDDAEAAKLNEPYRPLDWARQDEFWTNTKDQTRVHFAIRKVTVADIIGFVQITGIDPIHRSASIGLRIGDAADQGQGYGKEALQLAVRYCWNQLNLSRISLIVFAHNMRAIRLYEALGFEAEGLLRKVYYIDGQWIDAKIMALNSATR